MDWFPWHFGPSLDIPYTPATGLDGKRLPDELDVVLIELTYLFVANEQECFQCGHLLGRGLRVRHASTAASLRWPVWVDTKCWGWRRHPHIASITRPAKDLMLGELRPTPQPTRPDNAKDTA